jgi:hypothetical protein
MRCIVPIYFPLQKLMKQNQFSDSCTKNPEQQGSHICFCINLLHCHVSCSSGKLHFPYGSMKEKRILSWCFYENCLGLAYSLYGPGASPDPALGFTSWLYQVHGVTVSSLSSVSINSSVKWRQTGSVRTLSSTVGGLWVAASSDPPTPWGLLQFRIQETEAQNGRVGIQIWFLCLTAMLVTAVSHKRCSEQRILSRLMTWLEFGKVPIWWLLRVAWKGVGGSGLPGGHWGGQLWGWEEEHGRT